MLTGYAAIALVDTTWNTYHWQRDSEGMEECWTGLEEAWLEFDALRQVDTAGILTPEDVDRFVSGWQVRF